MFFFIILAPGFVVVIFHFLKFMFKMLKMKNSPHLPRVSSNLGEKKDPRKKKNPEENPF